MGKCERGVRVLDGNDVSRDSWPNTQHGQWMSEEYETGLVSVIVPTYNRASLIVESLDSVWAQTYRPIELLVVDDGSTDNTREVVEEYGREHAGHDGFYLRYFYQENSGAPAARNLGLIESQGEYIQFLDSDDLLHPEKLKRVVHVLKESACNFVCTGLELFCPRCGEIIDCNIPDSTEDLLIQCMCNRFWIQTALFTWRRNLTKEMGPWDENLAVYQDRDYGIRAILSSRQGVAIPEVFVSVRYGGSARIGDIRHTHEGYECRLLCLTRLCDGIKSRNVPLTAKKVLVSRLYGLGVVLYGKNYTALGRRFGQLAESLDCGPDSRSGARMRKLWRMGKMPCYLYCLISRLKYCLGCIIRGKGSNSAHTCRENLQRLPDDYVLRVK